MSARGIERFAEPCSPPWWARGAHAQTLLGHFAPQRAAALSGEHRRQVELDDGDRLVVHELAGSSSVLAILCHGLTGDVDSDYVRAAARRLASAGHSVWAVNHRGCGTGRGLAARPYHSGRTDDVRAVLRAAQAAHPHAMRVVVGFSISGNIALLHAAERTEPRADAVLAINPPIDLAGSAGTLHRGFNRLYELRFVARLLGAARELERLGVVRARAPLRATAPLVEFDDRFTAPVSGFASASDYYARCSAAPHLGEIDVPAVLLSSEDDPLVCAATLRDAPRSATTLLHLEPHGGHMAYVSRAGTWLERAVSHYVGELARCAAEKRSGRA